MLFHDVLLKLGEPIGRGLEEHLPFFPLPVLTLMPERRHRGAEHLPARRQLRAHNRTKKLRCRVTARGCSRYEQQPGHGPSLTDYRPGVVGRHPFAASWRAFPETPAAEMSDCDHLDSAVANCGPAWVVTALAVGSACRCALWPHRGYGWSRNRSIQSAEVRAVPGRLPSLRFATVVLNKT